MLFMVIPFFAVIDGSHNESAFGSFDRQLLKRETVGEWTTQSNFFQAAIDTRPLENAIQMW